MATMLSKLKKKELEKEVLIKMGIKEKRVIRDSELAGAIELAMGFYRAIKDIEPQLKSQKETIASKAKAYIDDKGTVTFIVDTEEWGLVECKVTFQYEAVIPEDRVEELRSILGGRFDDLVRVKTTYYATSKLIELATDGDRGKDIAGCITVKEKAAQISFK